LADEGYEKYVRNSASVAGPKAGHHMNKPLSPNVSLPAIKNVVTRNSQEKLDRALTNQLVRG